MDISHRDSPREAAALQVRLGSRALGVTRDISTTGVFFETDAEQVPGSLVEFTIAFETPGGPMRLKCHGQIVRVERRGTRQGVAVKILESRFDSDA